MNRVFGWLQVAGSVFVLGLVAISLLSPVHSFGLAVPVLAGFCALFGLLGGLARISCA